MARHRHAAAEYGETWRHRSLVDLCAEVREEGLDELTPELRAEAAQMVRELVLLGARSASLSARLRAKIQHG